MFFKKPTKHSNKYNRGAVGIITGSKMYKGAAIITAQTVLKTGVGIVFYYGKVYKEILEKFPEIIVSKNVKNLNKKINCLLIGSGNPPKNDIKKALKFAYKNNIPAVVDASAMFILLKLGIKGKFILTPHAGEYKNLSENKKNYITILKGYKTKVMYPDGK